MINPINENQADEKTKKIYQEIKEVFNTNHLPIFFTFLAPFPEYFSFLTNQIIPNINDQNFLSLVNEMGKKIFDLINQLPKSQEVNDWISRYQNTPSFYHFQADLNNVFLINLKIAMIFIAIRESIKGWAIGAKRLKDKFETKEEDNQKKESFNQFIFDQEYLNEKVNQINMITLSQKSLAVRNSGLEKNLLPEYLILCRNHFFLLTKEDEFWLVRLGIEKIILQSLEFFPKLISSSFNQVIELTKKYHNFNELIYLLYEKFPTLSVQRLMFSGFLRVK